MERRVEAFRLADIQLGWQVLATLNGEMAQMACEEEIDRLQDMTPSEYIQVNKTYQALMREAKRRRLIQRNYAYKETIFSA